MLSRPFPRVLAHFRGFQRFPRFYHFSYFLGAQVRVKECILQPVPFTIALTKKSQYTIRIFSNLIWTYVFCIHSQNCKKILYFEIQWILAFLVDFCGCLKTKFSDFDLCGANISNFFGTLEKSDHSKTGTKVKVQDVYIIGKLQAGPSEHKTGSKSEFIFFKPPMSGIRGSTFMESETYDSALPKDAPQPLRLFWKCQSSRTSP